MVILLFVIFLGGATVYLHLNPICDSVFLLLFLKVVAFSSLILFVSLSHKYTYVYKYNMVRLFSLTHFVRGSQSLVQMTMEEVHTDHKTQHIDITT